MKTETVKKMSEYPKRRGKHITVGGAGTDDNKSLLFGRVALARVLPEVGLTSVNKGLYMRGHRRKVDREGEGYQGRPIYQMVKLLHVILNNALHGILAAIAPGAGGNSM